MCWLAIIPWSQDVKQKQPYPATYIWRIRQKKGLYATTILSYEYALSYNFTGLLEKRVDKANRFGF